jgi:hypothetical protein
MSKPKAIVMAKMGMCWNLSARLRWLPLPVMSSANGCAYAMRRLETMARRCGGFFGRVASLNKKAKH